ncbi:hypothetical protein BPAE_0411g00010 [Botrytis paeoniae]|uniref:Uncharacterized protein n=1 Tax=Botrytis paeoniae TaxID=278948 RepID=A0A4Z1F4A6_9HELO|nr:hypothetical protein BPAE_0411g00010 [Botrytis paeoniae]
MLCEELTRCWFHSKKNLSIILLAARLPSNDSRLPSWVPDWENRQSALDYRLAIYKKEVDNSRGEPHTGDRASNGSLFDDSPETATGELHLRGLSLSLILRALACDIPDHLSPKQSIPRNSRVFKTWCCAFNASSFYSTYQESRDAMRSTIYASESDHKEEPALRAVFGLLYDLMLYPNCQLINLTEAKRAHELLLKVEDGGEQCRKAVTEMVALLSTPLIDSGPL